MSASEIIDELPKLTEQEKRLIRRRLVELAAESADIAACNEAATQGALILDRLEEEDGRA